MSASLEKKSPCKVNFLLNILGKRPDGFHELETVMQPIALHDELQFSRGGTTVKLTCSEPSLPTDSGNLVYRAAESFLRTAKIHEGIRIHLQKTHSMAAGLGGGSGNAATTLLALNEIFGGLFPWRNCTASPLGWAQISRSFCRTNQHWPPGGGKRLRPFDRFKR
jgi:4-diphosphocytidyl-2-C-methyl-D-erythritol kinase